VIHGLVQLLSIFAEVSEEIERERAAIYGWFPPKVELRVRTTDLEKPLHPHCCTVLSYDI